MMKKRTAILLALVMVFVLAACGPQPAADPTEPQTAPATEPEAAVTIPDVTVENSANYIQLSISYEDGTYVALTAYDDGMGAAYLEYLGDVKKVATMDLGILDAITAELENCGLAALNGANEVGDGFDSASMYVAFPDETYWGAGYTGFISAEFLAAYEKMDAYFQTLLADVPEYVPQPVVMGDVNADALAAVTTVLENSGMEPLDMFCIMDVPAADAFTAGLTSADGIVNITSCGPVMMATAYSFVIATVEEDAAIENVRKDFASNLDWAKWVCVSAEKALIAQQGSMVVCVMASGDLYTQTAAAIEAAGWTEIEVFENPNI